MMKEHMITLQRLQMLKEIIMQLLICCIMRISKKIKESYCIAFALEFA